MRKTRPCAACAGCFFCFFGVDLVFGGNKPVYRGERRGTKLSPQLLESAFQLPGGAIQGAGEGLQLLGGAFAVAVIYGLAHTR